MIEMLKRNNKIIVNTDIDGILSAYVLWKYCGCEIVGFSNSDNCVWWRKDKIASIYDGVYVDMYVPRKEVLTIDQHIVAYDEEQCATIASFGTKINPNLENPRFFASAKSYKYKYPFATVHYIMAKLGGAGIDVCFDLSKEILQDGCGDLCFGDFLLRADDAMKTTLNSPYEKNAREWWSWLSVQANERRNITDLIAFLKKCPTDEETVEAKKKSIATFFRKRYGCRKTDGGFKKPCDEQGYVSEETKKYFSDFWKILGEDVAAIKQVMNAHYEVSVGTAHKIWITPDAGQEMKLHGTINGQVVFSYAFVNSQGGRLPNFSYTVM